MLILTDRITVVWNTCQVWRRDKYKILFPCLRHTGA